MDFLQYNICSTHVYVHVHDHALVDVYNSVSLLVVPPSLRPRSESDIFSRCWGSPGLLESWPACHAS